MPVTAPSFDDLPDTAPPMVFTQPGVPIQQSTLMRGQIISPSSFDDLPDTTPPPTWAVLPPALQTTKRAGLGANVGAGLTEGITALGGMYSTGSVGNPLIDPQDFAARAYEQQQRTMPVVQKSLVNLGMTNPEDVAPGNTLEKIARIGARTLPIAIGGELMAPLSGPIGPATTRVMGGVVGTEIGELASQYVPDAWKPATQVLGSMLGGIATGGGAATLNYTRQIPQRLGLHLFPSTDVGGIKTTTPFINDALKQFNEAGGPAVEQLLRAAPQNVDVSAPQAALQASREGGQYPTGMKPPGTLEKVQEITAPLQKEITPADIGQNIRGPLTTARAAEKAPLSTAYAAHTSSADISKTDLATQIQQIRDNALPGATPNPNVAEAARIIDTLPDTIPFAQAKLLNTKLNELIDAEGVGTTSGSQLVGLKKSLHAQMSDADPTWAPIGDAWEAFRTRWAESGADSTPLGEVLAQTGRNRYNLQDEEVIGRFKTPSGIQELLDVTNNDPRVVTAVGDHMIGSLQKQGIIKPNGEVDAARLDKWRSAPAQAAILKKFSDLYNRFADASTAQREYNTAYSRTLGMAQRKADSIVGNFIGVDPDVAIPRTLSAKDGAQQLGAIHQAIVASKGAPQELKDAAISAVKRGVTDYVAENYLSPGKWNPQGYRDFLTRFNAPLKRIFGGTGYNNFSVVAAAVKPVDLTHATVHNTTVYGILADRFLEHLGSGATVGTTVGAVTGSPVRGIISGAVTAGLGLGGALSAIKLNQWRTMGINNAKDIVSLALRNPDVAQILRQKGQLTPRVIDRLQSSMYAGLKTEIGTQLLQPRTADYEDRLRP